MSTQGHPDANAMIAQMINVLNPLAQLPWRLLNVCDASVIDERESSKNHIKRSGICKTAVPNPVNDLLRLRFILHLRSVHNRYCRSSPDTFLELLRQLKLATTKELANKSTLSTQHGGPNLCSSASVYTQASQIDLLPYRPDVACYPDAP